jgi:hypothetical protein
VAALPDNECRRVSFVALSHNGFTALMHRRALGVLFAVLATGLGLIAVLSALEGGRAWVVALAAGALALWMFGLAYRALVPRT